MTKQQPTKLYHTCIVPVNTRTLPFGTYHVKYYWKTFIVKSILAFEKFQTHSITSLESEKNEKSKHTNKQPIDTSAPFTHGFQTMVRKSECPKSNVKVVSCMNSLARTANLMKFCAHDVLICVGKSPGLWKIL